MRNIKLLLIPFLLVLAGAVPAVAQGIPDNIPDEPGQSLVDRERERMEERYRGFLSRFYTMGSLDLDPVTRDLLGYQATVNVGMAVWGYDAVHLTVSARSLPVRAEITSDPIEPGRRVETYFGAGYALNGTRILGEESPLGRRSNLNLGVGVLTGEVSALAFEVAPTYDLIVRNGWAVPVGVKVNVATIGSDAGSVTRTFAGLSVGVRWWWMRREQLE
jgi:hypothetical protein